jgi:chromosome partitioning protein
MFPSGGSLAPRKIVVLNAKGGSGKTTVATNLAAWLAVQGEPTALMDYDPQGCSTRWLANRPEDRPAIHGIAAYRLNMQMTRTFQLRTPPGTRYLVVDTSAAIPAQHLADYTRGADALIIPVGASDIDIHAAAGFISDLLLIAKEDRSQGRVAVVANRVRTGTVAQGRLMRFLDTLSIPCLTVLRDSQVYAHAAQQGLGLHEFKPHQVRRDLEQWIPLLRWVERRCHRQPATLEFGVARAPAAFGAAPLADRLETADAARS